MLRMDPNLSLLYRRGIIMGIQSTFRERRWFAAFGALFGVLLMLQILLFGLLGMQTIESVLLSRTDLKIEIRAEANDQDRQTFFSQLNELPYVSEAVYITREQAYEHARLQDPELITFLEKYNMGNPFQDTIGITLRSLDDYTPFASFIEQESFQSIINPTHLSQITQQEAESKELLRFIAAGRSLAILVLILAVSVLVFITTELVRRRSLDRADEVFVEQLGGAHPLTIFLPFATEATLLLWAAIIMSSIALVLILAVTPSVFPAFQGAVMQALGEELAQNFRGSIPILLLIEFIAAPILASLGAWAGVRPTVRSKVLSVSN